VVEPGDQRRRDPQPRLPEQRDRHDLLQQHRCATLDAEGDETGECGQQQHERQRGATGRLQRYLERLGLLGPLHARVLAAHQPARRPQREEHGRGHGARHQQPRPVSLQGRVGVRQQGIEQWHLLRCQAGTGVQ